MRFKPLRGGKTNILKEKPKLTYSVALVLAFLSANLEDLSLADYDCLPERLLLLVRTKFGKLKMTTTVVFVIMIQRIFPS